MSQSAGRSAKPRTLAPAIENAGATLATNKLAVTVEQLQMRRLSVFAVPLMLIVVGACTSGPAATSTTAPITAAPGTPSHPVATATPAAVGGSECDAIPTFSLENPETSFPPDEVLESAFPGQIAGQPVTEVRTFSFAAWVCWVGGQAAVDELRSELQGGMDLPLLSTGTARVTVDGETVSFAALRLAGRSGTEIVDSFAQLAALWAPVNQAGQVGEFSTQTVGVSPSRW
jgi:hypothetical protein